MITPANNVKIEIPVQVEVFDAVMPSKNNCKTLFGIFKDGGWLGDRCSFGKRWHK